MTDPAATFAALGVWMSFQTVSLSTPQPPHGSRDRERPAVPRTRGDTA